MPTSQELSEVMSVYPKLKYFEELSCGLTDSLQSSLFADVQIEVEGETFNCHRIILASMSHYFKTMFTSSTFLCSLFYCLKFFFLGGGGVYLIKPFSKQCCSCRGWSYYPVSESLTPCRWNTIHLSGSFLQHMLVLIFSWAIWLKKTVLYNSAKRRKIWQLNQSSFWRHRTWPSLGCF